MELERILPHTRTATFALVPSSPTEMVGVLMLELPDTDLAAAYLKERGTEKWLPPQTDGTGDTDPEPGAQADDRGRLVFAQDSRVVITTSASLKAMIQDKETPAGKRFSSLALFAEGPDEPLGYLAVDLVQYRKRSAPTRPAVLSFLDRENELHGALRAGTWLIARLQPQDAAPPVLLLKTSHPGSPAGSEEAGICTWALWIVGSLIGIVVGLILLLVIVTLLLALYFYLVQWYRGELSPMDPPREATLSPEIKEDLQSNPLRFAREAGAATEDKPDSNVTDTPKEPDSDS